MVNLNEMIFWSKWGVYSLLGAVCLSSCEGEKDLSVCSPDGKIQLSVSEINQVITYSVEKEKTAVLLP